MDAIAKAMKKTFAMGHMPRFERYCHAPVPVRACSSLPSGEDEPVLTQIQ